MAEGVVGMRGEVDHTSISRSGSRSESGRSRAASTALKSAVLAPSPKASESTAAVRRRICIALRVAILGPLPDVADHVVKTEGIGGLDSTRMGLPARIAREPGEGRCALAVVPPPEPGRRPRARRVLPFRFAGQ